MRIEIPILDLFVGLLLLLISIRLLFEAWVLLIKKRKMIVLPFSILMFFIRISVGKEIAEHRKDVVINTIGLQGMGLSALVGGILLTFTSIFLLYGTISRITYVVK